MTLAVACGLIFLGVTTVVAWGLRHLQVLNDPRVQRRRLLLERLSQRKQVAGQPQGGLEQKLFKAGFRSAVAVPIIMAVRLLTVVGAAAAGWVGFRYGLTLPACSFTALAVVTAGWWLPDWWLSARMTTRLKEISRYLPDMLDLLVICLEAGLGFNGALVKVAQELEWTSPVLSDELHYTIHEIQIGQHRAVALRNLGKRCSHPGFNALLAVIIQAEKFGMSLAKTLRIQVDAMRMARRQRIQEIVHKLPVKMVFPLVFFIFPELLAVILGPAAIHIYLYYLKGVTS